MSDKTNREAAADAIKTLRDAEAMRGYQDEREKIGRQMCVDLNCTVLTGMGELLDMGVDHRAIGDLMVVALGNALLTYLMTATGGDGDKTFKKADDYAAKIGREVKKRARKVASEAPASYGRTVGNA